MKETVVFIKATAFGKVAEAVSKYKKKGDSILVSGRLQLDQWTTAEGTKRQAISIVTDDVKFLGLGKKGAQKESEGSGPTSSPEGSVSGEEDEDEDIGF